MFRMTRIDTRMVGEMPLIVERIPGVRSAALTWLLPAGSARLPDGYDGMTAMWSEMICRGAGPLDSRAQADAFDRLGVSRGTRVETFYLSVSATLLGSRVDEALPLIVDMVRRPTLGTDQVEPVRDLCLQAIAGLADDPQERAMVELRRRHAPVPINRSSLGSEADLRRFGADEPRGMWADFARPGGSILALAGDVDIERVEPRVRELLQGWSGGVAEATWKDDAPRGVHHIEDDTNQVHIAIAHDSPSEQDEDCWLERVVCAVLSGGMSGRLFTEVREKRSLCYSVYASYGADARYGRTVAYSGTTPERAQETVDVLLAELRRIHDPAGRVTEGEFQRAMIGLKSRLVMSGESSGARAGAIARDHARIGRARTLDELTGRLERITLDEVNAYLTRRELGRMTAVTIGPAALNISL
ncbi:MAG: insulinase family protein [Phycisphaerales bacterium]|nr:insulinase family protein [Phycisphaerales bacterium]